MVRNSVSRASTISAEECLLTLTEDDFLAIQRKMDRDWMTYIRTDIQNIEMP